MKQRLLTPLRCSAVILAAGFSSRMGEFKPLLPLGSDTVVGRMISLFRRCGVEDVHVVVGYRRDEMKTHLLQKGVTIVENPVFESGMFSSVQAGVRSLNALDAFFVTPVDIPLTRPVTIRLLKEAMREKGAAAAYPCFRGKRGHPPLIRFDVARDIVDAGTDKTLRDILSAHEKNSKNVDTPDRNILFDADTAEDYEELLKRYERIDIPTDEECEALYDVIGPVSDGIKNHCRTVADVAVRIGEALNENGACLDVDLIKAAALLHDIAKGRKNHAETGGLILNEMGFTRTGAVAAGHSDVHVSEDDEINETDVVFLADKCVKNDRVEVIENRYLRSIARYGSDPVVYSKIVNRWIRADKVRKRMERVLSRSLYDVIAD